MASLIGGYNYDIFTSYRQKDNKGGRWVSDFVEVLKTKLESTFKEEIRGLLQTKHFNFDWTESREANNDN